MKISYLKNASWHIGRNSLLIWALRFLAVFVPALLMGYFINVSPQLTIGLLIISIYCFTFCLSPKKTLLIFGVFLVFQSLIVQHTGGLPGSILNNLDELLIILSFLLLILKRISDRRTLRFQPIGFILLGITFVGFISNYSSQLVNPTVSLISFFLLIKGFLIFYIFLNMDFNETEIRVFTKIFLIIGLFVVFTTIINVSFPGPFNKFVGGFRDYRLGMLSAISIFGHPGGLGTFMSILTCFSFAFHIITKERRFLVLTIFFLLTMLLSLRITPALGTFLACTFAIFILSPVERKRTVIVLSSIGVTLFLFFADKIVKILSGAISGYITDVNPYKVARDALYLTGFKIAWDYFPFGAGFGTFGGWMSRVNYSPLYYKYGLRHVWGLSPEHGGFINDTFWPHIMAELGIIGFIFYLLIFYQFFKYSIKGIKLLKAPFQRSFALGTLMVLISSLVQSIKLTIYEMSLWAFLIFGSIAIVYFLLNVQESGKQ